MNAEDDFGSLERRVAVAIVARFVADRLLPEDYAEQTVNQLAEGRMKIDDWRFLAENALDVQARSRANG